jgi:hypothetical protein
VRPVRRAGNLTTVCELIVWKYGILDVSRPDGSRRHHTGIVFYCLSMSSPSVGIMTVLSDVMVSWLTLVLPIR